MRRHAEYGHVQSSSVIHLSDPSSPLLISLLSYNEQLAKDIGSLNFRVQSVAKQVARLQATLSC